MKISVVTVVFNGAETIADTVASISRQSHPDIEHIVIDGGSTDGTLKIIKDSEWTPHLVISETDKGLYDAMNKGISYCSGEVIGFLNADDFYEHGEVLESVSEVFKEPEIDACYADLVYVDANDLQDIKRYWTSQEYKPGLFEKGWMPAHPTFFVRKSVYEKYGGFDLRYRFQSDYELTARFMAVEEIHTRYIPEIWVRMRMGGTTNRSLSNIVKGNLESYRACKRLGLDMKPWYFITKFAMRIPQFFKRPDQAQ